MDAAETRANAVAMLRRAASLPRLKDGRRPPLHGETGGVSEGERSRSEEKREVGERADPLEPLKMDVSTSSQLQANSSSRQSLLETTTLTATSTHTAEDGDQEEKDGENEHESSHEHENDISEPDRPPSATPSQSSNPPSKRRSRSRSRSRGSKDMRAKLRQLELAALGVPEAGPDDVLSLETPALTSPQAYLMQLQMASAHAQAQAAGAPSMFSPISPFAVSPGVGLAGGMGMPTLQVLQNRHLQGLFRSNSAAARMMAMHKLTGGSEPLDLSSSASADGHTMSVPSPQRAKLSRNNTVAGEERVAARQQLLRRLNERLQDGGKADVDPLGGNVSSGPDDMPTTTKGRRRRSRRKSQGALVDDRDAANTPAALALRELYPPLIALPPSRAPSIPLERQLTPASSAGINPLIADAILLSRTPTPMTQHRMNHQQQLQLQQQQQLLQQLSHPQQPNPSQFDSPMKHRGPVVEEEDDDPIPTPPRQHPRQRASPTNNAGTSAAGSRSTSRQDVYLKSPFERPREEPPDDEPIWNGNGGSANGAPARATNGNELLDREISWLADPVPTLPMDIPSSKKEIDESRNRDVSWVEPSSLGSRMPIYDEDEDEESTHEEESKVDEEEAEHQTSPRPSSHRSPHESSQELLIDLSTTAPNEVQAPNDYSREASTATATRESHASDVSISSRVHIRRNSSSSFFAPGHERTQSTAESISWGDYVGLQEAVSSMEAEASASGASVADRSNAPQLASKRSAESTWSKMKGAFSRSGSSLGRRSRTNSIAKRNDTESSRESAASLGSGRTESKGDVVVNVSAGQAQSPCLGVGLGGPQNQISPSPALTPHTPGLGSGWPQTTATARSPSPGAFMHGPPTPTPPGMLAGPSLSHLPQRTGASPIPPPMDSEAAKYLNPKLFPFPGMATLRGKSGAGAFASSSPDVSTQAQHGSHVLGNSSDTSANSGLGSAMSLANTNASNQQQQHLQQQQDARDHRLSHQASDSRLLAKYQLTHGPAISGAPSSAGVNIDYFTIPQHPQRPSAQHHSSSAGPSGSGSLPFTREGVKKWLSARLFPSQSQQGGTIGGSGSHVVVEERETRSRPVLEHKVRSNDSIASSTGKKASLSDLLGKKEQLGLGSGEISDWEEAQNNVQNQALAQTMAASHVNLQPQQQAPLIQARAMSERTRIQNQSAMSTATTASASTTGTIMGQGSSREASRESVSGISNAQDSSSPDDPLQAYTYANAFPASPGNENLATATEIYDAHESRHTSVPLSSSHDPSSTTPDPGSSEESPSQTSQRSTSSLGSLYNPPEHAPEPSTVPTTPQATGILQRLDAVLNAEYTNRLWSSALTSPPRRLLLCTPMLQVANCNTVKDRFLFLFSDLLVIAKPMLPENRDSLVDPQKVYPPDRKYFVKNVVHLKDLNLNVDRDEDMHVRSPTAALVSQRPEFIRRFVTEFNDNADLAIAKLIDLRDSKGPLTLGRLLVQLPEIDRAKLGEYLSRRTSKAVLRAYIDMFGFNGINIDTALRIFLLSIHMPSGPGHSNTLETLLDTFAARWYEANASIVAFDRDLAMRLVRAIVRLNEALHSVPHEPNGNSQRMHVTARDFTEAFRRHDQMGLVADSSLERIYMSVRHEKFCQARNPTNGRAPLSVSLKRPIPPRITYRRQSEPIVVRIPQADPHLTIELFGQDLCFDPPVLSFAKSAEASFRITGTSFGIKSLVLACMGPNAPNYSGMPLSTTVNVERAFMRNTFQLAFADISGRKRKYMFSVDDPVIRHEWTGSLKRQMEAARTANAMAVPEGIGSSSTDGGMGFGTTRNSQMQVYRAADMLAFTVLQETLLAHEASLPQSLSNSINGSGTVRARKTTSVSKSSAALGLSADHSRSRSRSRMYYLGAGKQEFLSHSSSASDIERDADDTLGPSPPSDPSSALTMNPDVKLWTGAELELVCQQNSAIALVLSFLQAALPYDAEDDAALSSVSTNGALNGTSIVSGSGGTMNLGIGAWNVGMPFQFPAPTVQRNASQSSAYQI